jgi:hypothetical protein
MAQPLTGTLIDDYGRPVEGAVITVKKAGTATLATLYSDEALTSSIGSTMTTEADGSYLAYAANGQYDLYPVLAGYTFDDSDYKNRTLFDPEIVKTVTATYTLSVNDYIVAADATSASLDIDLPALADVQEGRAWVIYKKDTSGNTVTIDPNGAETINGSATLVLSGAKQGVIIAKVGSEWITYVPTAQVAATPSTLVLRTSGGSIYTVGILASSSISMDSGTADTPQVVFYDPINDTQGYIDVSAEIMRFVTEYRGAASIVPFSVRISDGLVTTAYGLKTPSIHEAVGDAGVLVDSFKIKDNGPDPTSWPSFRAYRTATLQNVTSTALTKVQIDAEVFDTNSDYDHVTNYRFTPTVAGKYLVVVKVALGSCDTGTFSIELKRGATIHARISDIGTLANRFLVLTDIVDMDGSTEYLEVYVQSTTDTNYNVVPLISETYFGASRIA